jgi:hypothetical protein
MENFIKFFKNISLCRLDFFDPHYSLKNAVFLKSGKNEAILVEFCCNLPSKCRKSPLNHPQTTRFLELPILTIPYPLYPKPLFLMHL